MTAFAGTVLAAVLFCIANVALQHDHGQEAKLSRGLERKLRHGAQSALLLTGFQLELDAIFNYPFR